jgi:hypothetical protein
MVAHVPRDRYQTMTQVLRALERQADRSGSARFKTYADPALRGLLPTGPRAGRGASSKSGPSKLDLEYLQPLAAHEFDSHPPQPARTLPPLRRRRRWRKHLWWAILGGAALIVSGTILVLTEGCALF